MKSIRCKCQYCGYPFGVVRLDAEIDDLTYYTFTCYNCMSEADMQ